MRTSKRIVTRAIVVAAIAVVAVAAPAFATYDAPGYGNNFGIVSVSAPTYFICADGVSTYTGATNTAVGSSIGLFGVFCGGGHYDYGYHALWSSTSKIFYSGSSWVVCGGTNSAYNGPLGDYQAVSSQHYNCGHGLYQGVSTHWASIQGTAYDNGIYPYFSGTGEY